MTRSKIMAIWLSIALPAIPLKASSEPLSCEAVFSSRLVLWPSHGAPPNPVTAAALPKFKSYGLPIEGEGALTRLSPSELAKIATDDLAALWFVRQDRTDYGEKRDEAFFAKKRDRVQRLARILSLRINENLVPQTKAFPSESFRAQARISGLAIETKPEVFRFDQRGPMEIKNQGGFFPNPQKQKSGLTIIEHSFPNSLGGFYVSTTTKQGNELILPSAMFSDSKVQNSVGIEWLLKSGVHAADIGAIVSIRKAFEYKIKNLEGVEVREHGIDSEKEFVTNAVDSRQISEVREVVLIEFASPSLAEGLNLKSGMTPEERAERRRQPDLNYGPLSRQTIFGPWTLF